jgi:hypothetical protein
VIANNPSNYSSQTQSEIERLEALGFDRRNMKVMPDGSIVFIDPKKVEGVSRTAKENAQDNLDKMIERKKQLDYAAMSTAVAGMETDPDLEIEYIQLCKDIDEAMKLLKTLE